MSKQFEELYAKADAAGRAAVEKATIVPMVVGTATSLFGNEIDRSKPTYFVADGPCGFAYLHCRPSRGGFSSWLKKNGIGRYSEYNRSWCISVSQFNQSLQKKEAYAYAFAKVVSEAGINISVESRLD
jgi:hypothetical protein